MKMLIIDYGKKDTCFYIEDTENATLKKSRSFNYNIMEIVRNSIDILKRNPDIKIVKIDKHGFGIAIIDEINSELKHEGMLDVNILGYRIMAL